MRKRTAILALGLSLFASLASAESLSERAKAGESIRIGFTNEAPYSIASASGELVGSDIVLMRAVLKKMGIKEFDGVLTQFGSLIPGLKAHRFDIVAAGLYINPDRCKQVIFSEPNFAVGDALLLKSGNPKNLHSLEDVAKDPNIVLGYQTGGGAIAEHALKLGVKPEQMVTLPDQPAFIAAIKAGRVDAVLYPALSVQKIIDTAKDPEIERASPFRQPIINGKQALGIGGYAFRTEDKDFVDEFNRYMVEIVKSPDYIDMIKEFGFTTAEIPNKVTTAELCASD